jgi:hypothetical protein
MAFRQHEFAEERKHSSHVLIRILLQENAGLSDEHRQEFLRLALYKVTEAEGAHKLRTRFMSDAAIALVKAMGSDADKELQHEHVFQRAKMAEALIKARSNPDAVDELLSAAVGCTVTKDEHHHLSEFKHLDGWERYRKAGIAVIDTKEEAPH